MKNIFPKAVEHPKLVKPYAPLLGKISAVIVASFALLHLLRIESLASANVTAFYSKTTAMWFISIVLIAEVFAIPFLLRLRLSMLAHIFSGFFVILAPLLWTLLSIWSLGFSSKIGQFGELFSPPSLWLIILFNILWLAFSFYTLWALGYNNLKLKDTLRKK